VAVVEFADATHIQLSPETAIRLPAEGPQRVQLIRGVLRGNEAMHRPRQPLVVTTAALHVRVEGDRFILSSATPDSFRVDMEEGKAEVVRQSDQKRLTVETGAALLVQAEAPDMTVGTLPRWVTEPRRVLDFPDAWAAHFEPDGRHLLAASYREIRRYGPDGEVEKIPLSTDTNHGRFAAFSRDGGTLAVYRGVRREDPVILWDVRTRQQLRRVEARVTDQRFALAPDASWLATVDKDGVPLGVQLWDAKTGARRTTIATDKIILSLAASPAGDLLAIGRNKVQLLEPLTGKLVADLPMHVFPVTALAFSPDGRYLAVGTSGAIHLWDVEKRSLLRTTRGFERIIQTLAFSPDGRLLAGGTVDGQVWVWDAHRGDEVQVIQAGTSGVRVLTFAPDGRSLVTGGIKGQPLMLWDVLPALTPRPPA
jgi:WD40 repeat protein